MVNNMLNLGDLLNLIKYPSLTEKSINLYGDRQYTFIDDRVLTKTQTGKYKPDYNMSSNIQGHNSKSFINNSQIK